MLAAVCLLCPQDWRQTLWSAINTDLMDEGAKNFVKEVKALPKKVRDEDVFRGVDAMVKNFLVSVPLVADLRSPAMRDRHWQQLMSTTKVRQPREWDGRAAPLPATAQAEWWLDITHEQPGVTHDVYSMVYNVAHTTYVLPTSSCPL